MSGHESGLQELIERIDIDAAQKAVYLAHARRAELISRSLDMVFTAASRLGGSLLRLFAPAPSEQKG